MSAVAVILTKNNDCEKLDLQTKQSVTIKLNFYIKRQLQPSAGNFYSPILQPTKTVGFTIMSSEFKSSPIKRPKRRHDSDLRSDPSSNKSKIAPRSSLQFKIGPPFGKTIQVSSVHSTNSRQNLIPRIDARIDRGFDLIGEEWIGYKRNYFSVVAAFQFEEVNKSILQTDGFQIEVKNEYHHIKSFSIRLVSRCLEDNADVPLVQHTAKRDRGPQVEPPVVAVVPGSLPSHFVIKESSNIRKAARIMHFDRLFYDERESLLPKTEESIIHSYPPGNLTKVVKYERIQFASSVQHRKPITGKRNFILQVELMAQLQKDAYAVIAFTSTPPLTVRGRSPSNYTITRISGNQEPRRHRQPESHHLDSSPLLNVLKKENVDPNFRVYSDENIISQGEPFGDDDDDGEDPPNIFVFDSSDMFESVAQPEVFSFDQVSPFPSTPTRSKFYVGEASPEPLLMEPQFYLHKSLELEEENEERCLSTATFSTAFTESRGGGIRDNQNIRHDYYKTYLDDLEQDQVCVSPSLLFSIPE